MSGARKTARPGRFALRLTEREETVLKERAALHSMTVAAYVRSCTLFHGPNGTGSTADAWWDALPAARRLQVYGWLNPTPVAAEARQVDGQTCLDDPDLAST